MSQTARAFITAEIAQSAPGYREARIYLREPGTPEPFGLIAFPQSQADDREALAVFGWRVVGDLEYVAGLNQYRGTAEPCEPEGAEALRETVRREIRALALARLAHPGARHFHPVQLNGDGSRDPIGWTFVVGSGDQRVHGWVTASGYVADGIGHAVRADAARSARHAHMMQLAPSPSFATAAARVEGADGTELARLLLTVRSGEQIIEEEPAEAEDAEDVAEEAAPFEEGDRIVCADGVARTVKGMAPAITGEPDRVIVENGAEWIAENCRRANPADVREAHERRARAAERVRTLDSSAPEWRTALAELGTALDYLKAADPYVRAALAEEAARAVHSEACGFQPFMPEGGGEQPIGWTFRVYVGNGMTRYGVVTAECEVAPIGLHEYVTTAERVFRQHIGEQPPARYRGVPVPAGTARQWHADGGEQWRAGVDAALASVALGS